MDSKGKIICPYFVVNNEEELKKVEDFFSVKKYHKLKFPFSIGKEVDFIFYTQETNLKDFFDKINNNLYVYEKKSLNLVL